MRISQRTFGANDFDEDGPAIVETGDIDPKLLEEIQRAPPQRLAQLGIEKNPEVSKKEKEDFKKTKEKKEKSGSLKLKGLVLKGTGKEACVVLLSLLKSIWIYILSIICNIYTAVRARAPYSSACPSSLEILSDHINLIPYCLFG